ncbi:Asp-tRNA(Asn)/Glu-tRNA(Gln) amidotransferase subunit GatB [Euzebya tangerina]|uniref:Asp-tRNA(Asn)/Glu-tRNA(Gln) amidotransferase subunit GatB n=1 Tax=Euzebya tangerina TaxID=591198 RepID=UPI000E31793C|nr:Asp-tRNA(Asn)/Glu-tRNA(Gln) amidotransferase subunit GatB [Euzebya tangerina]
MSTTTDAADANDTTTTGPDGTVYQAVIGLEVHVELSTKTKMFSACPNAFGGDPNTRVSAVDLGLPGTLPVVNGTAVEYAIRLGLALDCAIEPSSQFHRKNYFYPDMPKNYQISQYDIPICGQGHLDVTLPDGGTKRVGITRVHMEEDAGKTTHAGETGRIAGASYSLVDYNRAGVPLLECVSEPDIRSADEAQAYLTELRAIVLALGISDAKLEEGSMRCDANVSVHRPGTPYGTRAEVKNLNSVRSLGRAISYEITRQVDVLSSGGTVVQETRHWNEDAGRTSTLRRKETLDDYRYFPDPDLVEVAPDPEWIEQIRASLPELPAQTRARLTQEVGVDAGDAVVLYDAGLVPLLDAALAAKQPGVDANEATKWLTNEVAAWQNEHGRPATEVLSGEDLAALLALIADGTLAKGGARKVLADVMAGKGSPTELAADHEQVSDTGELERIVEQVIAEQADAAQKVRDGNTKAIGALVGGVMRATQGKANPAVVNQLLAEKLTS